MLLPNLARAIWRRWYVVLLGLALTAGLGLRSAHTEDLFLASEVLVIQPPVSSYNPNPMTGLYPSLAVTAAAVANRLNTPDAQAMFRSRGVEGTYTFEPRNTGTNQEPRYVIGSMSITSTTHDEAAGLRDLTILSGTFDAELRSLQDQWNVDKTLRITEAVLVPATTTLLPHSPLRSLIGSGLLGMVVTIAGTLWTDEIVRRRRARSVPAAMSPPWAAAADPRTPAADFGARPSVS